MEIMKEHMTKYGVFHAVSEEKWSNIYRYTVGNGIRRVNIELKTHMILGFRRDVDVICGLLGNYTATDVSGRVGPIFTGRDSKKESLGISTREDGTDTLSRIVGK
jgi:hypothetical protein